MQLPLRRFCAPAALVFLFSSGACVADDNAPVALSAGNPPLTLKLSPLESLPELDALPAEDYKEGDVWGRIRSGFAIADIDDALVAKHMAWYSSRPDYIARTSARASRYLFHVVQELEKRGMPTELALLPIVESAFNPQAYSSANAAGMWQFVPGTGRDYNLTQNLYKDQRRDVLASTNAALSYLQRLYDMFGDWPLALAAYNWGEGNVARAIKKNQAAGKPTDFESLAELMPAETRNYVPKLQAVKNIISNPAQYGIALPVIENQPYFTTVDKTRDIDLNIAARLAELSVDEFKALNPQFSRPVITGGQQTKILLPQENAEKFHLNLAQWGRSLSTWTTHKITSAKETIASLAARFGTTPEVLRQANNIPARSHVKAGSTLLVPKTSASTAGDIVETGTLAFEADREAKRSKGKGKHGKQVSEKVSDSKHHGGHELAHAGGHSANHKTAAHGKTGTHHAVVADAKGKHAKKRAG